MTLRPSQKAKPMLEVCWASNHTSPYGARLDHFPTIVFFVFFPSYLCFILYSCLLSIFGFSFFFVFLYSFLTFFCLAFHSFVDTQNYSTQILKTSQTQIPKTSKKADTQNQTKVDTQNQSNQILKKSKKVDTPKQ